MPQEPRSEWRAALTPSDVAMRLLSGANEDQRPALTVEDTGHDLIVRSPAGDLTVDELFRLDSIAAALRVDGHWR